MCSTIKVRSPDGKVHGAKIAIGVLSAEERDVARLRVPDLQIGQYLPLRDTLGIHIDISRLHS